MLSSLIVLDFVRVKKDPTYYSQIESSIQAFMTLLLNTYNIRGNFIVLLVGKRIAVLTVAGKNVFKHNRITQVSKKIR